MVSEADARIGFMSVGYFGAPRPRVLAIGMSDDEIEVMRSASGSVVAVTSPFEAHPEEHDVLVIANAEFHEHSGLFPRRLVFAGKPVSPTKGRVFGYVGSDSGARSSAVTQNSPARDLEVTADAGLLAIEALVRRSCMPSPGAIYKGLPASVNPARDAKILLRERLDRPLTLAAIFESDGWGDTRDSAIWLPHTARAHLKDWLLFAFGMWRERNPEMFPVTADWMSADEWSAPDEIRARNALTAFDEEEERRQAQAAEQRAELVAAMDSTADHGTAWRSLISETGEELVAAVKGALEYLGFTVIDSDALPENKDKKQEDLRVIDDGWVALAEVKGYTGSAKSNDLHQVTRAATTFALIEQRTPDALWYIPNTQREIDPSQRETALAGRDDDLASFAKEHDGCLIDTRDLFALRQRVATGECTAEEARALLKDTRGRFTAELAPEVSAEN
ncbi:hypothetical protein GCM10022286_00620 [Gryllotalpicola daejeonensis]|uniref:Restriction endonuclease n=1 Tax=Gryllotalpicola daejeonensis TaxID=993087 RepID=A0ABP7ZCS3_9MICO